MRRKQLKSAAGTSAPVFAALGDERRLLLLARLSEGGPVSISGLAAGAEISRQGITKHLHVLARAGLVRGRRRGREQVYEFDPKPIQQASDYLDVISRHWDEALTRLKDMVEGE